MVHLTGQIESSSVLATNHLLLAQRLLPPWAVLQNKGLYSILPVEFPEFEVLNLKKSILVYAPSFQFPCSYNIKFF
jgi:hypothetical protein